MLVLAMERNQTDQETHQKRVDHDSGRPAVVSGGFCGDSIFLDMVVGC
jgi:hypothetical protein